MKNLITYFIITGSFLMMAFGSCFPIKEQNKEHRFVLATLTERIPNYRFDIVCNCRAIRWEGVFKYQDITQRIDIDTVVHKVGEEYWITIEK